MDTKDLVVKVPAHVEAFGQQVENFLLAVDKAVEDGWQTGTDVPPLITAALTDLVPAMQGYKDAQTDITADLWDSVKGLMVHIVNVVQAFATKPL